LVYNIIISIILIAGIQNDYPTNKEESDDSKGSEELPQTSVLVVSDTIFKEKMLLDTETDGKRDVAAIKRKWLLTFLGF